MHEGRLAPTFISLCAERSYVEYLLAVLLFLGLTVYSVIQHSHHARERSTHGHDD